ncbi:phage tail tube protein, partial [Pleionea sediminis]|uniref:phage tail tube protein n=1 Tax=Pleionea sediminis TaxID=2569479 RepID=UPI0011865AC4
MLVKREVITLAVESTYNVNADPGVSDGILVEDLSFSYAESRMVERNVIKPTFGKEQSIFAGTLAQVTFTAELKGSGERGVPPEIGRALRCCGFAETVIPFSSVYYDLASEDLESCTIKLYQDGRERMLTGCRGTAEFNLTTGDTGKVSFTFTGHIPEENDRPLLLAEYHAVAPPPVINAAFRVSGFPAVISALSINLNNSIVMPPDLSAPDGFGEIR